MTVHLALKLGDQFRDLLTGHCSQDVQEVRNPWLLLLVISYNATGIGHCGLDTFGDQLWFIQHVDQAGRGFGGLGHLGSRVLQVVDACPFLRDEGLRNHEGLAETVVEALGQVTGQLHVLALVITHRDPLGLVEQDVRGHQNWVGEKSHAGCICAALAGLILELGHPACFPETGNAVEHPS